MDIYALSTPTQMILAWILLGILLTWLVVFAILAFRFRSSETKELDDVPTPTGSMPIIDVQGLLDRLPEPQARMQFAWESDSRNKDSMPPQQTLAPVAAQVASAGGIERAATTVNIEITRDGEATSSL